MEKVAMTTSSSSSSLFLKLSSEIRYLGVYMKSGSNLKWNFDYAKHKYYGRVNAILSKCYYETEIAVYLCKSFCTPYVLYGTEAMNLNHSEKILLSHGFNRTFSKLLRTFDKDVLSYTVCVVSIVRR